MRKIMLLKERIRMLRARSDLSQEQFAAKLKKSQGLISKWEDDASKSIPTTPMIETICDVFGVSADSLYGRVPFEEGKSIRIPAKARRRRRREPGAPPAASQNSGP